MPVTRWFNGANDVTGATLDPCLCVNDVLCSPIFYLSMTQHTDARVGLLLCQIGPNGTILGFLKISFSTFWRKSGTF